MTTTLTSATVLDTSSTLTGASDISSVREDSGLAALEGLSLEELASIASREIGEARQLQAEAIGLTRRSTATLYRAGRVLWCARKKLTGKGKRAWTRWQKDNGIPTISAWQAICLYEEAEGEEAVAGLTRKQALQKYGITKPKKAQPQQAPVEVGEKPWRWSAMGGRSENGAPMALLMARGSVWGQTDPIPVPQPRGLWVYTNMENWAEIRRRVLVDGQSKRSVCREFSIHGKTLEKIFTHPQPPGYRRSAPRARPKLDAFLPVIHQILEADKDAPRKQRHTIRRIFRRLRDEYGYTGGLTVVSLAVSEWRRRRSEVFVPLAHPPGEAQVDFGEAEIVLDGQPAKVALFVMTLPDSDAIFVHAFHRECTEAFLEGHVRAFTFFGGVPRRISYDNLKIAVARILDGRDRKLTDAFLRLRSHQLFEAHFCRVRRPNEKGHVETLVGYARRNFLVPVPSVHDGLEAINADLEARCHADLSRQIWGKPSVKVGLLDQERAALLSMPTEAFVATRVECRIVDSLSLVGFDSNQYSVPTKCAHHRATVVGSVDTIRVVVADRVVATHRRCWDRERIVYDPVHYLALLERKPVALDFAVPLAGWELPVCFGILRRRLEAESGGAGTRQYITILRLLEWCRRDELTRAVEAALELGVADATAVRLILEHRRERPVGLFCLDGRPRLQAVTVPPPDLRAYAGLMAGGTP